MHIANNSITQNMSTGSIIESSNIGAIGSPVNKCPIVYRETDPYYSISAEYIWFPPAESIWANSKRYDGNYTSAFANVIVPAIDRSSEGQGISYPTLHVYNDNAITADYMFALNSSATYKSCNNLITNDCFANVVQARYMFQNRTDYDISIWMQTAYSGIFPSLKDGTGMFKDSSMFLDDNTTNFSALENADYMFENCVAANRMGANPIAWITAHPNITSHEGTFRNIKGLNELALFNLRTYYPDWM